MNHSVLYAHLLNLGSGEGTKIPMDALRTLELPMPDDVLEQFCADHATNSEFQEQYGQLDLCALSWRLRELPADQLVRSTVFEQFQRWVRSVRGRIGRFEVEGWACIDCRPAVIEHWKAHRTWLRSPIFLDGSVLGRDSILHLAEGHTRIGILTGLLEFGVLDASSLHRAWIGSLNSR
jgi:hypothetical protein